MKRYGEISARQIPKLLNVNVLVCILLGVAAPFIFSLKNAEAQGASNVIEAFLSIIGIIMLPAVFLPEQDSAVAELIESKPCSQTFIHCARVLIVSLFIFLFMAFYVFIMAVQGGSFPVRDFIFGGFISAFALGAVAFAGYGFSGNVIAGYMLAILYFILNLTAGPKKLKMFYLFSLKLGDFTPKYYILTASIILIIITLVYKAANRKLR